MCSFFLLTLLFYQLIIIMLLSLCTPPQVAKLPSLLFIFLSYLILLSLPFITSPREWRPRAIIPRPTKCLLTPPFNYISNIFRSKQILVCCIFTIVFFSIRDLHLLQNIYRFGYKKNRRTKNTFMQYVYNIALNHHFLYMKTMRH